MDEAEGEDDDDGDEEGVVDGVADGEAEGDEVGDSEGEVASVTSPCAGSIWPKREDNRTNNDSHNNGGKWGWTMGGMSMTCTVLS